MGPYHTADFSILFFSLCAHWQPLHPGPKREKSLNPPGPPIPPLRRPSCDLLQDSSSCSLFFPFLSGRAAGGHSHSPSLLLSPNIARQAFLPIDIIVAHLDLPARHPGGNHRFSVTWAAHPSITSDISRRRLRSISSSPVTYSSLPCLSDSPSILLVSCRLVSFHSNKSFNPIHPLFPA